jgi:virginiamycin A acetyltransferase
VKEALKALARGVAQLAAVPWILSYTVRRRLIGADRSLEGSSQALAWLPGVPGQYIRRAFLQHALAHCATTATIEYGVLFSQADARIGENVYVGPRCHIGLAHIGRDTLIAAGVHIPSGGATHGIDDLSQPIREQEGVRTVVSIGENCWIGSAAVVMTHVGDDAVIGAGAVVTKPVPARAIAGGVPARVIRMRAALAAPSRIA